MCKTERVINKLDKEVRKEYFDMKRSLIHVYIKWATIVYLIIFLVFTGYVIMMQDKSLVRDLIGYGVCFIFLLLTYLLRGRFKNLYMLVVPALQVYGQLVYLGKQIKHGPVKNQQETFAAMKFVEL